MTKGPGWNKYKPLACTVCPNTFCNKLFDTRGQGQKDREKRRTQTKGEEEKAKETRGANHKVGVWLFKASPGKS